MECSINPKCPLADNM
jgi:hypothetical protein